MDIIIRKNAYCKFFLHLSKYPYSSCNGVFLSAKSASTSTKPHRHEYVDCVPLFHSSLSLSPSFEIALNQIDAYCQQNELEIGGYYHANENINDNQPNMITFKIAEKIKENFPQSLVFVVNNHKIHPSNREPCFTVYNCGDQRLKECNADTTGVSVDDRTFDLCGQLLKDKKFSLINDFDNHLDDLKADWRNPLVTKLTGSKPDVESVSSKRSY